MFNLLKFTDAVQRAFNLDIYFAGGDTHEPRRDFGKQLMKTKIAFQFLVSHGLGGHKSSKVRHPRVSKLALVAPCILIR